MNVEGGGASSCCSLHLLKQKWQPQGFKNEPKTGEYQLPF